MTGLMDKAIALHVNQNELDLHEKFFNTSYGISKNKYMQPFSDYTLLYLNSN